MRMRDEDDNEDDDDDVIDDAGWLGTCPNMSPVTIFFHSVDAWFAVSPQLGI